MSSAEITLGAHLFLRSTEESIPVLLKNKEAEYSGLKLAMRDMVRFLNENDCIGMEQDGSWRIKDDGINALSEDQHKAFVPLYQTAVMAHEYHESKLVRDGKAEYMKEFRELHSDTIIEIEPDTMTRVRGDDMRAITSSALNLLQAVHDDPANATFVRGLEQGPLQAMTDILYDSGYLIPGENPNRAAPLGDQTMRGTADQQDALYHQASQIAANIDKVDTLKQGDRPLAAAMLFKQAVDSAHVEEVETIPGQLINGDKSDLMRQDCNSIYNVASAFARVAHTAQWDTMSLDSLLVDRHHADDLRVALADYYDNGINHCLMSGSIDDPKMTPEEAIRLGKGIDWMNEALSTDMKAERFSGDDGGMMTQGGKSKAAARDYDEEFSGSGSAGGEGMEGAFDDPEEAAATDTGKGTAAAPVAYDSDADLMGDVYGRSERKVRVPEAMIFQADMVLLEMLDNGTMEYMRQRAGRAEMSMGDIESSKAAFGSLDEAMGQFREAFSDPRAGRSADVITSQQIANMNPERRARLRTAKVQEGRGPFKGYRTGSPDVAGKRMTRWLDDNMLNKDGEPNYDLRRFLRDATQLPVEAKERSEGEALRTYAEKFVARDRDEVQKRREAGREKRGLSSVEFSAEQIGRLVAVKEAEGSTPDVKLIISQDGNATLFDKDTLELTSPMSETSENLAKALSAPKKEGREFGGMISVESLKAAYQTGADKVSILIDGETPYGVIGKVQEEERVKKKEKAADIVLS